jgi:MFS family permease
MFEQISRVRQLRTVLGAAIGLSGCYATLFFSTLTLFLKPIAAEFGWGRAQTAGATVLSMLGMAVGAVIVGRLIDRFGAAKTISASVILLCFLVATMSRVGSQPGALAALSFAIGLVGVATTPLGYLSVMPKLFDGKLGLALGCSMLGLGLGAVGMPVLAQSLIDSQGWRSAYVSLAGVALVCGALAWILIFAGFDETVVGANPASQMSEVGSGVSFGVAVRQPQFWLLTTIIFLVSAAALGYSVHAAAIITDRGLSGMDASKIVGVSAVGVMLGRLLGGALMDHFSAAKIAAISFGLGGLGLWLVASDTSNATLLLITAGFLASFAIGTEGDLIPFAVRRYFGNKSMGSIFGVVFSAYALGGVIGPIALGVAFDKTGDYRITLYVFAGLCVAAALLSLLLGPYRYAATKGKQ